jgi:hypothetical protein
MGLLPPSSHGTFSSVCFILQYYSTGGGVFSMLLVYDMLVAHFHRFHATRFGSLNVKNDTRWWVPNESYR